MELLLILFALSIIVYVIHQSSSATKLKKARELMAKGDFSRAQIILEAIFSKQVDSPFELAKCKLQLGLKALPNNIDQALLEFKQIVDIEKRLTPSSNKESFFRVKARASLEICKVQFNKLNGLQSIQEKISYIAGNLQSIDNATKLGVEKEYSALRIDHLQKLSELYYLIGVEAERHNNLVEAEKMYLTARDYASQSSDKKTIANSLARQGICSLKRGQIPDEKILIEIIPADDDFKADFYFRLAVRMLYLQKYPESERIIARHLSPSSIEVQKLNEIIHAEKVRRAVLQIESINLALDKLYEKSFPIEDVKSLYEHLDEQIDLIEKVLPEQHEKVMQLKPSLLNRILTHYISERQFAQAINYIQKFPSFWESPELLQNLGICCYNFTNQGNLTEKNYRTIISSWLTAVYADKVMLKSIESTLWDDAYSFSLIEAVGSKYSQYDDLPENVNYDDLSETNISIGATQRELINRFEALLQSKVEDAALIRKANSFYSSEKEAIEMIISIIPKEIFFSTPYFAKVYGVNDVIINELDNDFREYADENALKAGMPYLKNNSSSIVAEYASVIECIDGTIEAIEEEDLAELQKILTGNFKLLKNKYDSLDSLFEESVFNLLSSKIEEDDENESLIRIMDECIQIATTGDRLKYLYSKYVSNFCISKVNEGELNHLDALSLMKQAYLYSPDNSRICKNLVTLIHFNLMDVMNNQQGAKAYANNIKPILNTIYSRRSSTLLQSSSELGSARVKILSQLKARGVDISMIESDTLPIYHNLTAQGLILRMVLSEFKRFSTN